MRTLQTAAARFSVVLGAREVERIGRYLDLLALWNRHTRLTGQQDPDAIITRHVVDSMAPARLVRAAGLLVDVGSGAGFPGIILGILRPDVPVVLLESRRRRVSFLREVIRELGLTYARVLEMRAEDAAAEPEVAGRAKVVIARAIRLDVFLALAAPLVAPDGTVVAMQTARSARLAAVDTSHGFVLRERHGYALPDGTPRTLLVFVPGSNPGR